MDAFWWSMLVVFVLGLICFSLLERRAEVASIFNNRRVVMTDSIVSQNEKFKEDFPREYETWAMTEDTTFQSKYNGSQERDILKAYPDICNYLGWLFLLKTIQYSTWSPSCY